jgi:hypothetical protein
MRLAQDLKFPSDPDEEARYYQSLPESVKDRCPRSGGN